MTKKTILLALLLLSMLLMIGCGKETAEHPTSDTYSFTDSAGRTVELPKQIDRIAPSGGIAQMTLFAIVPDKLVGISSQWKDSALPYLRDEYRDLPILGQFYGMKNFNKEAVLSAAPQVIIDVGEKKATIVEDMDRIQEALGIPVIFIEARLDNTDEAYRTLGKILDREQEGHALADYCRRTYQRSTELAAQIGDKPTLLYVGGAQGNMAVARGSFHAQVIDLLADNAAVVTDLTDGSMTQVSMEQVLAWNPQVLVIAAETEPDFSALPWRELRALQSGRVLRVPAEAYDWMGRPPSVNRFLGLSWLAARLYPEQSGIDLKAEMKEYYRLFYHYELDDAACTALLAKDRARPCTQYLRRSNSSYCSSCSLARFSYPSSSGVTRSAPPMSYRH